MEKKSGVENEQEKRISEMDVCDRWEPAITENANSTSSVWQVFILNLRRMRK